MRSIKALELLNAGRINELRAALEDEVYQESLKRNPSAKRRYSAMKKYFTYSDNPREICQHPARIEFQGKEYTSFTNSYSMVLTTEPIGEIELLDESINYPDVTRLINFNGEEKKVNFAEVIALAKTKGYKLKKSEFYTNKFLMKYNGIYFRIPLLDSAYSLIDDGEEVSVYHEENSLRPLVMQSSVGIALILPIRYDGDPVNAGNIVIEVSEEGASAISNEEIAELINRRRRQVLVHSTIYYNLNSNIVSDAQWAEWAKELAELQKKYPSIAADCVYADDFQNFDPSTGYNLPIDDTWAMCKAMQLLRIHQQRRPISA